MVLSGNHNPSSLLMRRSLPGAAPDRAMQNEDLIREIATKAFCEALQENVAGARREISPARWEPRWDRSPAPRERTRELRDGPRSIAGSRTQTETLETLLAAASALTPGCGLMVVRGAQATGWSCHGLAAPENFKRANLDCARGVAATVISSCAAAAAQVSELDPGFTSELGLGSTARILLVPVLLKERVAALLIALSQQSDDLAGLEVLVQVAQLVLDLQAYRKASPQPAAEPARQAVQSDSSTASGRGSTKARACPAQLSAGSGQQRRHPALPARQCAAAAYTVRECTIRNIAIRSSSSGRDAREGAAFCQAAGGRDQALQPDQGDGGTRARRSLQPLA